MSLSNIFNFKINKTLKETILNYPEIKVNNYVIIPLYHPVHLFLVIDGKILVENRKNREYCNGQYDVIASHILGWKNCE